MLDALDDRYRARNVVDVGIEDDVAELKVLAGRLAPEDVVLALVGAESDYWSVPLGDDGTITIRTARVWRRPSAVRPRCA